MSSLGLPLVRLLLPLALLVAAAGTASATDPLPSPTAGPTLQGENLVAPFTGLTVTSNCDESGSMVSYDAVGVATGPFPGTFEAHGELTIGAQTILVDPPTGESEGIFMGPILTLTEMFTIVSGATTITGTKTLTQPLAEFGERERATCQDLTLFGGVSGTGRIVEVEAATTYQATIQTPSGTFTDSGRATPVLTLVEIRGQCAGGVQCESRSGNFDQLFTLSDQAPPPPPPPTCEEDDEHKKKGCEDDDD